MELLHSIVLIIENVIRLHRGISTSPYKIVLRCKACSFCYIVMYFKVYFGFPFYEKIGFLFSSQDKKKNETKVLF